MTIIIMQIAVFITVAWLLHRSVPEPKPVPVRVITEPAKKH